MQMRWSGDRRLTLGMPLPLAHLVVIGVDAVKHGDHVLEDLVHEIAGALWLCSHYDIRRGLATRLWAGPCWFLRKRFTKRWNAVFPGIQCISFCLSGRADKRYGDRR